MGRLPAWRNDREMRFSLELPRRRRGGGRLGLYEGGTWEEGKHGEVRSLRCGHPSNVTWGGQVRESEKTK